MKGNKKTIFQLVPPSREGIAVPPVGDGREAGRRVVERAGAAPRPPPPRGRRGRGRRGREGVAAAGRAGVVVVMRVAGLVAAPPVVVALAFGPAPYGTPLVRTVVPGTGAAALSATAPPASSSAAAAVPVSFDAREGRVGAPFALGAAGER